MPTLLSLPDDVRAETLADLWRGDAAIELTRPIHKDSSTLQGDSVQTACRALLAGAPAA